MSGVFNAFQEGLYNRLISYAPLTALLGGTKVYDHVPQGTDAPYVVIGEDTSIDFDTKTNNGWELTLTIHCWDFVKKGRKSVKNLMASIYEALHEKETSVSVAGYKLVLIRNEYAESFQDTTIDGGADDYYHGVLRFRAIITETI